MRNVVEARLEDNASAAKVAEQQVVGNAKAIAGAIEPYYGGAASEKLFGLLAGHWGAISAYLNATHAGKKADQDAAFKKLVNNAGEISAFLGGANPHARTFSAATGTHRRRGSRERFEQENGMSALLKLTLAGTEPAAQQKCASPSTGPAA